MWHNPRLLNGVAGFLTALGVMAFLGAGANLLTRSPLFPLREVAVQGTLARTARADVERAMHARVSGNFFAADLADIRDALEQLPWVRRVDVRRAWPDRIVVTLEEHVVLARWSEAGLVNQQGERFVASTADALPVFSGPDGSESDVTRRYRAFLALVRPLGVAVERIALTSRRAWQLELSNGLHIELGRDQQGAAPEERLQRFVAAWPATLGRISRPHQYVDLRYPNGFALRLPGV